MLPTRRWLTIVGVAGVTLVSPLVSLRPAAGAIGDTYRADVGRALAHGDVRADRVVVQVDAVSLDKQRLSDVVTQLGGHVTAVTGDADVVAGVRSVELSGSNVVDAIYALRAVPGVVRAGPDVVYHASLIPTDPQFGRQWNLHNTGQSPPAGTVDADIDAPEGWDTTTGTATTVVAVVDSGVQLDHGEFAGRIWANPGESCVGPGIGVDDDVNGLIDDCSGYDFVDAANLGGAGGTNGARDNDPSPCGSSLLVPDTADCNGLDDNADGAADGLISHGTHVAGIVAATQSNSVGGFGVSGVAPGATIMPVRALTEDGIGSTVDVIAAMNYAITEGAKVINMSFGSDVFDTAFNAVVSSALTNDVLLVAAAGNAAENLQTGFDCDSPVCNDDPSGTGANGVLAVAATNESDRKASFSNFSSAEYVDVAAPGTTILSTCYDTGVVSTYACSTQVPADVATEPNEFSSMSGTSQATPHVAGVAALVRSQFPGLSGPQSVNAILFGADDVTAANSGLAACGGADCTTGDGGSIGRGRLNAANAFSPHIVGVSPSVGIRSTQLDVSLIGVNTSWSASSAVNFGEGIGVSNLACASGSSCTATLNITNATPLGQHDVSVTSGSDVTMLADAFLVTNAVLRIAGDNRVKTAVEVSKIAYPNPGSADAVVLARSDTFPDSLAGTPFARAVDAPILFTPTTSLDPDTSAEILRVLRKDGDAEPDIYLLGGDKALGPAVEAAVKVLDPDWTVERVAGANRSETSVKLAEKLHDFRGGPPTAVLIATHSNFPDALAAAVPAADTSVNPGRMPVLLTDGAKLSAAVEQYLIWHGANIQSSYVVGGTAAVSDNVAGDVDVFTGGVKRLSGSDRYATAVAIDDFFYAKPINASFASGKNFPDALAGSYLSALRSSPMLLINGSITPQSTIDYVSSHASTLLGGYMFGGTAVVPEPVRVLLESII